MLVLLTVGLGSVERDEERKEMREAESWGMLWEAFWGARRRRRCSGADLLLLSKMSVQPLRPGRTARSAPFPAQQRVYLNYLFQS